MNERTEKKVASTDKDDTLREARLKELTRCGDGAATNRPSVTYYPGEEPVYYPSHVLAGGR